MDRRLFLVSADIECVGVTEHGDRVLLDIDEVEKVDLRKGDVLVVKVPSEHWAFLSDRDRAEFRRAVEWDDVVFVPEGMEFGVLTRGG